MTTPPLLDIALRRLHAALDQLEAAAERRAKAEGERADLEEELSLMQDDRTRLATELDGALARGRTLDAAGAEVARRLREAGSTLRGLIRQSDEGT
jgi:hypothetical protein